MILACSCFDGVKGRICDHVLALYFDRKIMRPFSEQHIAGRFTSFLEGVRSRTKKLRDRDKEV